MELDKSSFESKTVEVAAATADMVAPASAETDVARPTPGDLQLFLPWACRQLEVAQNVLVTKEHQVEYVSGLGDRVRRRSKTEKSASVYDTIQNEMLAMISSTSFKPTQTNIIKIITVMNAQDKCVHLKLLNNKQVPRILLKILGLVMKFHIHLSMLTINMGLDMYTLHELKNLLPFSNITDICLDDAGKSGLDYSPLFSGSNLRQVSLARCQVDDKAVAQMAELITPSQPASAKLRLLNLASNQITDHGARYLADMMRTNRTLNYLNVSDNRISDSGGTAILEVLGEFELSPEEIGSYRERLVVYLNQMMVELLNKLRSKLKTTEVNSPRKQKSNKYESNVNVEQKAVLLLNNFQGNFIDPYSLLNTVRRGNNVYCTGNNALAYLNMSYCNLHYITLKKLVHVMEYQKVRSLSPRGLVSVSIEGNPLPHSCDEYYRLHLLVAGPLSRRLSYRRRPKSDETRTQ